MGLMIGDCVTCGNHGDRIFEATGQCIICTRLDALEKDAIERKSSSLNITVCDGKYTVYQEADGKVWVLRYGKKWRDATGDGLILALAQAIERLRNEKPICKIGTKITKPGDRTFN